MSVCISCGGEKKPDFSKICPDCRKDIARDRELFQEAGVKHICYSCGVNEVKHPFKPCPECYSKIPSQPDPAKSCYICGGENTNLDGHICHDCYLNPGKGHKKRMSYKPKRFFLWDFRKRKVCCGSFFYGGFMFISLTMLVMSFLHWNLDYLGISLIFMLFSTIIHKTIPLSGKDKE